MSKPKHHKSGSKSKKRTPARKIKPKCELCREILWTHVEIAIGYCEGCLTRQRSLDPKDTLLQELREKNQ